MKQRLYDIIFEADSKAGKAFDIALLITIITSIVVVMLESVISLREAHGTLFLALEWFFTGSLLLSNTHTHTPYTQARR